jgi:hypothetical protein
MRLEKPGMPAAPALATLALAALAGCAAPAGGAPPGTAPGDCLGRLCLGMTEVEALAALDAQGHPAGGEGRFCFHLEDADLDLSFRVAGQGDDRRVASVLVTALPHCDATDGGAADQDARGAGVIADCRGVRPGDPEAFVAKMHRRAAPAPVPDLVWPAAPADVRGLADRCAEEDGGPASLIYLRDGRVVGLAIHAP